MSEKISPLDFRKNAAKAVENTSLRQAMRTATDMFISKRNEGLSSVPIETWRDQASAIRLDVLDHLPEYVDKFSFHATRAGAVVHRARDAQTAREVIRDILRDHGARKIVKAKSMITEEMRLNEYLEESGFHVVETDLGEYIVQIAGEKPSHILAPAIHKTRRQVGELFSEKLSVPYSDDPFVLTKIARTVLREEFLTADAGISGANFAVADSGSLAIFTNEGNGRMVTTLPRLHIAALSIEKIIPTLNDLSLFARLLPRSATGQILSSYLSIITGSRKPGESTGTRELHIVLLDNGRSEILGGKYREILKCIRCSACFNVCPVYRTIGGHAYGVTYPGPMGIVLTSLLEGMGGTYPLVDATTLCGACVEVCPVRVPLVKLLTMLREERVDKGMTSFAERAAMNTYGLSTGNRRLFSLGQRISKVLWPTLNKINSKGIINRLPKPASQSFGQKNR
ncbi:MAG: LutB/LldF family L-lactate oxidation iron-sulfur protein [Desulfomonilaceae bacterium]|jgi:L-lactate dehydrogenase complex protein LldF